MECIYKLNGKIIPIPESMHNANLNYGEDSVGDFVAQFEFNNGEIKSVLQVEKKGVCINIYNRIPRKMKKYKPLGKIYTSFGRFYIK